MKDTRLLEAALRVREEERHASFKWQPGYSGTHNHKCAHPECETLCQGQFCSRHRPPSPHSTPTPEARKRHLEARKRKLARSKVTSLLGHEVI